MAFSPKEKWQIAALQRVQKISGRRRSEPGSVSALGHDGLFLRLISPALGFFKDDQLARFEEESVGYIFAFGVHGNVDSSAGESGLVRDIEACIIGNVTRVVLYPAAKQSGRRPDRGFGPVEGMEVDREAMINIRRASVFLFERFLYQAVFDVSNDLNEDPSTW